MATDVPSAHVGHDRHQVTFIRLAESIRNKGTLRVPGARPDEKARSPRSLATASCGRGDSTNDKQRSRNLILLATDNEVYGSGVYDLSEANRICEESGRDGHGPVPGSDISLEPEVLQLVHEVRKTGGDFLRRLIPASGG